MTKHPTKQPSPPGVLLFKCDFATVTDPHLRFAAPARRQATAVETPFQVWLVAHSGSLFGLTSFFLGSMSARSKPLLLLKTARVSIKKRKWHKSTSPIFMSFNCRNFNEVSYGGLDRL